MKYCYKCRETKDTSEFHKNKRQKDGFSNYCKVCAKKRNAEYYRATPEKNPQRRESAKRTRKAAQEYVLNYLLTHGCIDCGESDPVVLEFDHTRGKKSANISNMLARGLGAKTIQKEIDKCDVRCANCHRRATEKRSRSYKSLQ